jgi:CO/xanthine dehydrogenase Mo-binding subunit
LPEREFEDRRHVGRPVVRGDATAKVTGQFEYGVDVTKPGMLHAKIRRSEIQHGLLRRVDVAAAKAMNGVHAVLTGGDIGDFRASRFVRDEPILAKDRVRYHGEPVAVVAAETQAIAAAAAALIEVEYEPLPAVDNVRESLAPGAPLLHPDWESYWATPVVRRSGNILNHASLQRGDVDGVFAGAERIFEDTYVTQMVHQSSLEGRVAIAEIEPDGGVHVTSSHQYPFGLRQDLSEILHLPLESIRVSATGHGGGFGGKLYAGVEPYCVLLAQHTGRPVRLAYTREEELIATSPRMGATVHVRTAVDASGRLLARDATVHYDCGAYSESSPVVVGIALLALPGPYRWQALRVNAYAVYTNKANCGSYRGPGAPQVVFAGESQLDRIAGELDIDPLQLRLDNAVQDDDLGPAGQVLTGVSLTETLHRAAAAIRWTEPAGKHRGKGLACCWWTTTGGPSSAEIRIDSDGDVVLVTGATEIGTGALVAGLVQICADELGISPDSISLRSADTATTPYDMGAQGSRTLFQAGNAVIAAATDLRSQALAAAARVLGGPGTDMRIHDGTVAAANDPSTAISLAELARLTGGELVGAGTYTAPATQFDDSTVAGVAMGAFNDPSFSTHACEVRVDQDTGEVRLERYVAVQDVGRVINPTYAAGQVAGGAVQGIGQALFEDLRYRDGRVANPNFTDYKLPTIADVPPVETILVERPSVHGPYGAKGVGEPSIIPAAPAIANAVADAVGVRVHELPITGERVMTEMSGGRKSDS